MFNVYQVSLFITLYPIPEVTLKHTSVRHKEIAHTPSYITSR